MISEVRYLIELFREDLLANQIPILCIPVENNEQANIPLALRSVSDFDWTCIGKECGKYGYNLIILLFVELLAKNLPTEFFDNGVISIYQDFSIDHHEVSFSKLSITGVNTHTWQDIDDVITSINIDKMLFLLSQGWSVGRKAL